MNQSRKQTENNREEVYNYVKTGEQNVNMGLIALQQQYISVISSASYEMTHSTC